MTSRDPVHETLEMPSGWLPSSEQSQKVIDALVSGEPICMSDLPDVVKPKIHKIRQDYLRLVGEFDLDFKPRNLPLYHLIRENYPDFNWVDTKTQIHIETYFNGEKRSLLSYLLGLIPQDRISTTAKASNLSTSGAHIQILESALPVFRDEGVCPLSDENLQGFVKWIEKGQSGEPLTVISPVCPDYSTIAGSDRKYRFTFDSLGSGIGLSAGRIFESLEGLHQLFSRDLEVEQIRYIFCVGDFEAFSDDILQRLSLTEAEFIEKNRQSATAIERHSPISIDSRLFTDLCSGKPGWEKVYSEIAHRFNSGELGDLYASPWVIDAAKARLPLYKRWFALDDVSYQDLIPKVIEQGVEYATMGKIIEDSLENPLVLGADHHKMSPFYRAFSDLPVIYLDRNYE